MASVDKEKRARLAKYILENLGNLGNISSRQASLRSGYSRTFLSRELKVYIIRITVHGDMLTSDGTLVRKSKSPES